MAANNGTPCGCCFFGRAQAGRMSDFILMLKKSYDKMILNHGFVCLFILNRRSAHQIDQNP